MDGASYSEDAEVRFVTGRRAWFGMVACCAHIITPTQRVGGTTGVELDFVFIYMGNGLLLDASHTKVMSQFQRRIHESKTNMFSKL